MSNEWDLLCRTCGTKCVLEWNHGGDEIQRLIPHLHLVAALGPVSEILTLHGVHGGLSAALVEFARAHLGHDLIAVDEHRHQHDRCRQWVKCCGCGTTQPCMLDPGHDGDHSASRMLAPPPDRQPGWYHRMQPTWATKFYGFPTGPTAGQQWTASDGSGWVYELTGDRGFWELAQYAVKLVTPAGARDKILTEVAALMATDLVPDFAHPVGILAEAIKWAARVDPFGDGANKNQRDCALRAMALCGKAIEHMDGER